MTKPKKPKSSDQKAQAAPRDSKTPPADEVTGLREALDKVDESEQAKINAEFTNEYASLTYDSIKSALDISGIHLSNERFVDGKNWTLIEMHLRDVLTHLSINPGPAMIDALRVVGTGNETPEVWRRLFADACQRIRQKEPIDAILTRLKGGIAELEARLRRLAKVREKYSPMRSWIDPAVAGLFPGQKSAEPWIDIGLESFLRWLLTCFRLEEIPGRYGMTTTLYTWAPESPQHVKGRRTRRIDRRDTPLVRLHDFQQFVIWHLLELKQQRTAPELRLEYKDNSGLDISRPAAKLLLIEISSGRKGAGFLRAQARNGYRVVKLPVESPPKLLALFEKRPEHWKQHLTEAETGPPPSQPPETPKSATT